MSTTAVENTDSATVHFWMDGKDLKVEVTTPTGKLSPKSVSHLLAWYCSQAAGDLIAHAALSYRASVEKTSPSRELILPSQPKED